MTDTRLMPNARRYPMVAIGLFMVSCVMMLIWAHQGFFLPGESLEVLGSIENEYAVTGGSTETRVTPQKNNEEPMPSAPNDKTTQDHFDNVNGDTPSETTVCAVETRRNIVEEVCSTLASQYLSVKEDDYDDTMGIFVNHDQRIIFCMVAKAGSQALTSYFGQLNKINSSFMEQATATGKRISYLPRHNSPSANALMKLEGFNRVGGISLTDVQRLFPNYTKLIQVRHPLQRFVSGYYQKVILKWQRTDLDFPTFVEQVLMGRSNRHWMPYYTNTHPCVLHYDIILKVETCKHDQLMLRDNFGWESRIEHGHVNPNFNITDTSRSVYYKYDDFLNDFRMKHPSLFNRLLAFLQPDMDMFGYTWDEVVGSSCSYSTVNCC